MEYKISIVTCNLEGIYNILKYVRECFCMCMYEYWITMKILFLTGTHSQKCFEATKMSVCVLL